MSELKLKYKILSTISDEWFPRIKKLIITSRIGKCDVFFVTNDEKVYAFGDNIYTILGIETEVKVSDPTLIEELCGTDIKKVVFGDRFMVALTESNEVYTGGWFSNGRAGNREITSFCKPMKVFTEYHLILDIGCREHYTVFLNDKQQVYSFGSTFLRDDAILRPTLISLFGFENITSISCGYDHALALTQSGHVYAWGCNECGQLGLDDSNYESKPKQIHIPNKVSVKQISCGNGFSLILTTDGKIYSFGRNEHGQLGHDQGNIVNTPKLVSTASKYTEVLAFNCQSFAKNESNVIEFWGQNMANNCVVFPFKTEASSLQEAIILYTKYPFTIEPVVFKDISSKKQTKTTMSIAPNRVMRTMAESFNNPENNDFKFKIKSKEYGERGKSCPSDDPNNGYDIIHCHKWFVEQNCDYLKKMFANIKSVKENNEMEIKGYSYETFFQFIRYLYTDSIESKDINLLNELLLLSDMYSDNELKTRCVSLIKPLKC